MNYEQLDYTFWEEHVNYFTINTIQYLLSRFGFRIIHHETALFSGKCLMVFAVKETEINPTLKGAQQEIVQVRNYVEEFPKFKLRLKTFIEKKCASEQLMMYGCGARSSNFINLLIYPNIFPVLLMIKKRNKENLSETFYLC